MTRRVAGGPLRRAVLVAALAWAAPALGGVPPTDAVVYEIYVRSFQDSDGDGIGDLRGVTARLDYLDWLGVTDLWLMPINPSPSLHGYDPVDYRDVDERYGTLEDLRELLARAGERGMRVVLDLVVNHSSDQHPWFRASAAGDPHYRDYYVWRDEPPDWRGLGAGSPWHRRGDAYYLGLFTGSQPDLNYRNPAVVREMEAIAHFWLELGVAGFRIDAIQHVVEGEGGQIRNAPETFEWLATFSSNVHQVAPHAYLLGETWTATPAIARYHAEAGLDYSTNYPLWEALSSAIQKRSPATLRSVLEQDERLYPPGAVRGPFLSNHDQIRPATRFGFLRADIPRLKLGAALLLAMPGVPILYYGEEIGMPNGQGDDDHLKRTPMRWQSGEGAGFSAARPWHPFSSDDPQLTVAAQRGDEDSLLEWYRLLIERRRASRALTEGELILLEAGERSVLAFLRSTGEDHVLVLANFAAREVQIEVASFGLGPVSDLLSGEELPGTLSLPPTSARWLRPHGTHER